MKSQSLVFLLFLLVLITGSCKEDSGEGFPKQPPYSTDTVFGSFPVTTDNRDSLEGIYGKFVKKDDEVLLDQVKVFSGSVRLTFPLYPKGWLTDFEGLYDPTEEKQLNSLLSTLHEEKGIEIAVITIDSSWTTRAGFDSYVVRLHNFWRVGKEKGDKGILIGISRGYQLLRISRGTGRLGQLTDEEAGKVTDIMISGFASGAFFEGTRNGVLAIVKELE